MQSSMAMAKSEEAQHHHHHHHVRIIKIKGPSPTRVQAEEADDNLNNNNNKNKNETQQPNYLCDICNKGFFSVHALNGHARMHSHSGNKAYTPAAAPPTKKIWSRRISLAAIATAPAYDDDDDAASFHSSDDEVRLHGSLLRWPVFCKRNRRKRFDPLMKEAACTLLLLASGRNLEQHQEVEFSSMNKVGYKEKPFQSIFGNCNGGKSRNNQVLHESGYDMEEQKHCAKRMKMQCKGMEQKT